MLVLFSAMRERIAVAESRFTAAAAVLFLLEFAVSLLVHSKLYIAANYVLSGVASDTRVHGAVYGLFYDAIVLTSVFRKIVWSSNGVSH